MHSIPGYTLLETIIAGQKVKLYRAITVSDGKKVLLKIDQRGDKAAARCSHELAMAGGLDLPAVCRPLKLEYCGDIPVLVMEDRGGVLLQQYMEHARNSMLHALLGLRFIKNSPVYPIDSLEC